MTDLQKLWSAGFRIKGTGHRTNMVRRAPGLRFRAVQGVRFRFMRFSDPET